MPETIEQYVTRINSYVAGDSPLDILSQTADRLKTLFAGIPYSLLRQRPAPERWSALEQLVHLSDVEIVIGYRVRSILGADDGAPIIAYDQNAWQRALNYNSRELVPTLEAFSAARANNLRLYRSLTEAQWNKYGLHSERGKESVRDTVRLQAGHDRNHLRQIEALLLSSAASAR
jgi:DinB superfamily